jgi:hypothetical protein
MILNIPKDADPGRFFCCPRLTLEEMGFVALMGLTPKLIFEINSFCRKSNINLKKFKSLIKKIEDKGYKFDVE